MSHKRKVNEMKKLARKQIKRREHEIAAIKRRLRKQAPDPMEMSPFNQDKVRRSARLDKKRRHKAKRRSGVNGTGKK